MPESNRVRVPRDERRDLWKVWGLIAALVTVGLVVTAQYVGDPPPRRLVVATGVAAGGYDRGGLALRDALAADGITVELRRTAGSLENARLLREGAADVAFVQGGALDEVAGLESIASLYFEPLWVFVAAGSDDIADLRDLRGAHIEAGAPGSGTRAVARALLAACGADAQATLGERSPDAAVEALLAGRCDALFLVAAPDSPRVERLFASASVRALPLRRATALSRHFRYLAPLELTPGMIDLEAGLPDVEVPLVAPTATLVARADLHPAIVPLLYDAAQQRYGKGGLFEAEGQFPNLRNLDAPAAPAARRYERNGPSFLYRVLPFQLAAAIDRLKIMLLPLLTLLLPLARVAPPVYRWRIRSKIFRWYRVLLSLEQRVREQPDVATFERATAELDRVSDEISVVRVPLGYAEELYNLRMHIRLVRREFAAKLERSSR